MEIKSRPILTYDPYLPSVKPIPEGDRRRLPAAPEGEPRQGTPETIHIRPEDLTVLPPSGREADHVTYDQTGRVRQERQAAAPVRKGRLIDIHI